MSILEKVSENKSFGGQQLRFKHFSSSTNCEMHFSIFLPAICLLENTSQQKNVSSIYWLSGLTCTDENFVQKAGAQQWANKYGVALIAPDTSPRGTGVPDDPDQASDFGLGAGFYLNATKAPWSEHYKMYDYVAKELPALIEANFPITSAKSIMGHSMGGHGALTVALKNPAQFTSVSAFSPICNPINCAWGKKAFSQYLGKDESTWKDYDTCELIKKSEHKMEIWVDQGEADAFLDEQLKPNTLKALCEEYGHPLRLDIREGYNHSYFYIASFIQEHIAYHSEKLQF